MGEPNSALNTYIKRPDRIRDLMEYYLGEKMPDDWECREAEGFLPARNTKGKLTFRERDYLGKVSAWGVHFWLGIENQNTINLTYPWRLMEMDSLTYGREIEAIQEKNTNQKAKYSAEDDFKYRFKKDDVLEPVMNLMLYWGKKEWRRPRTLKEMMGHLSMLPSKLRPLIGNYRAVMIPMRFISDQDLDKMESDLKYVLGILKCTASRKRYESYILKNREYFSRIPRSAVDVIDVFTNIRDIRNRLQYVQCQGSEEETDMCRVIQTSG